MNTTETISLFERILTDVVYPSIKDARDYYPYGENAAKYRERLAAEIKETVMVLKESLDEH